MIWKYYGWELRDGVIYDRKGRILPYQDLPFSPNVIGSTKIIQGDFNVCLDAMLTDIEEERKLSVLRDRTSRVVCPNCRRKGNLEAFQFKKR